MLKRCQHYSNLPLISSQKIALRGVVSLLRRKPNLGFVGSLLGDLLGGGQFAPPMTGFFERFFHSTAGLLEMIKGLKFKNKKAAAFGCYGWHNTSTPIIENSLKEAGFEMIAGPSSLAWEPDEELLNASFEFGKAFIESFKSTSVR